MRTSNTEALLEMAGKGEFLFKVTDVTAAAFELIVKILVQGGAEIELKFAFGGGREEELALVKFRELCVAIGLDRAPEDESEMVGRYGQLWVPTHGGGPRFTRNNRPSFPYPSQRCGGFVALQGNDSTLLARRQARDISTRTERRPHGYGLLFEIENGRICGVENIEHSPVLWVEEDIWLEFEGTRRRGLRLVEWYGKGEAPAHALRWAADIYIADPDTAAFVRAAIEEKLENDHGIAVASGEVGR